MFDQKGIGNHPGKAGEGTKVETYFIDIILLAGIAYLLLTVSQMNDRIKGMKNSLGQIRKQLNIPEDPVNEELRQYIRDGKDVKAVKRAREAFGLTLVEGKQYVDNLKNE